MLNGMNPFNLGMRAADHAGITPVQMQAADDPDPTVYKAALVELLVAADRASAEKKMVIELTRRKGDIATAQQMDHHHNADYKERRAYKDMMKSARAEFLAKWVPGVGKGRAGLPKEGSGLSAHITAEVFVDRIRERCMREFAGPDWATEDNTLTIYFKGGIFDGAKEVNINAYDPALGISWPGEKSDHVITDKDKTLPTLADFVKSHPTLSRGFKKVGGGREENTKRDL